MSMNGYPYPERVVVAFSDVFGPTPTPGSEHSALEDFDTKLNQQFGNGTFRSGEFGIGDWPSLGAHGLAVLDGLRQEQNDFVTNRLGISPEEAAKATPELLATLRQYEAEIVMSVGHQALVGVGNHAARTEELQRQGQNGEAFHYGETLSGIKVVAHLKFFRELKDQGRLRPESLARIPNDAAIEAGVWKPGEQYRSRFAPRLVDHPEIHVPTPSSTIEAAVGDDRIHGGASYVDKFGNVIVRQHSIKATGDILRAQTGGYVDLHLDGGPKGKVTLPGVPVAKSLAEAPGGHIAVYLNPHDYPAGQALPDAAGHFEIAVRTDDPNDTRGSAYQRLITALTDGNPGRFRNSDWDDIDIHVTPAS